MLRACPAAPDAGEDQVVCGAVQPVFQRLVLLITQPSPSATALVSSHAASEPWSGSDNRRPSSAHR